MTHTLTIALADATDLAWAQATVTAAHYLHAPVDQRARPMAYIIRDAGQTAPAAPQGVRIGQIRLGVAAAGAAVDLAGFDQHRAAYYATILKGHLCITHQLPQSPLPSPPSAPTCAAA